MPKRATDPGSETCAKCGQAHLDAREHPGCAGHISTGPKGQPPNPRAGQPCRAPRMRGQKVCHAHGGRARQSRAKAVERIAQEQAEKTLRSLGEPIPVDPAEGLLDLIAQANGAVCWLRARVQAIDPDALVWGVTKETDDSVVVGNGPTAYVEDVTKQAREATPNVWLVLYDRWTDKLAKLCVEAIKIGLDERRVRLAERQGDMLMRVLDGVLAELGHDANDQAVAGVVARHLRLVDSAA